MSQIETVNYLVNSYIYRDSLGEFWPQDCSLLAQGDIMKSILFLITYAFFFAAWAVPQPEERSIANDDYKTCVFESSDVGKMKFRGTTREEAFERTARACLQARVEGYIKIRGDIPSIERKILFAEDCVNKTYCKH
jgi:hypothetical protein